MACHHVEVREADAGKTLAALVRELMQPLSWNAARKLCRRGKVRVDGALALDPSQRLAAGVLVEVRPDAPVVSGSRLPSDAVLFADADIVVVEKPAGLVTVPFESGDRDTLLARVRSLLQRRATTGRKRASELGVVQRLDKQTSGVLVFARTLAAKRGLQRQFRAHSIERRYLALAHGAVADFIADSQLVRDRGDGLRGSWGTLRRGAGSGQAPASARRARTDVRALRPLRDATLIECRLHTGRQHQIRIHLSERGHPLLGEEVYIRDHDGERLPAPRLMLHAAVLGFEHPRTGKRVRFERPPPADFQAVLERLGE